MGGVNERLRDSVEARRKELGLSPTKLAEAAGVTLQGLAPIRRGEVRRYQERLTGPLCAALGWTPDLIERILAGDEPELASGPVLLFLPDVADEVAELRELVTMHEARIESLQRQVEGMSERLLALAERSMTQDVVDLRRPAGSRTAR